MEEAQYQEALADIRQKLKKRRGYASRVVLELNPRKMFSPAERDEKKREVYNVAHGRTKDPAILKALIHEAESAETHIDPSMELISQYLKVVA